MNRQRSIYQPLCSILGGMVLCALLIGCVQGSSAKTKENASEGYVEDSLQADWETYREGETPNANSGATSQRADIIPSAKGEIIRGDSSLMELPALSGGNANYFITHRASGKVNYSVEYDVTKAHARWVAFSFDDTTAQDNVERSDAWRWDPDLPASYSTETWFKRSGYSRGHLVASEDRTFSQEANEQTFYYSNVSPQLQEHNAGIWQRLEKKVRQWGRNSAFRDVLYVAKGGTIRNDQVFPHRLHDKMVIPQYYWMALLLQKDGQYHSIAFLTEHRKYEHKEANIRSLALSVDELEKFTGLNLFSHLPEAVAREVEAEEPESRISRQTWWR